MNAARSAAQQAPRQPHASSTPPPSARLLARLARALATTPPGTNVADALGVAQEIARAWERIGRAELQRAAATGDGVRPGHGAYAAFARMAAGAEVIAAEGCELEGMAGGQLTLRQPLADAICDAVAEGMSLSGAASAAGVTPRTATSWRARGRAVQQRVESGEVEWDDLDPREQAVYLFAVRVARAEAEAERVAVRSLIDAARGARNGDGSIAVDAAGRPIRPGDWRAAMAWLERRHPQSWRRPSREDEPGSTAPDSPIRARPMQIVVHVPASAVPVRADDVRLSDAAPATRSQPPPPAIPTN